MLSCQIRCIFQLRHLTADKPVGDVGGKSLTVGGFLFAEEEIQLIHAVNRAILWDFRSPNVREGRVEVYDVNNLVVDTPRWHFARPANDEWRA